MNNFELTSFETPLIGMGPRQFNERELAGYFKRIPVLSYRLIATEPLSLMDELARNDLAGANFQFGAEVIYRAYRGLGTSLLERNAFFEMSNGQRKKEAGRNLEVAFGVSLLHAAGKLEKELGKYADEFDAIYNKGIPAERTSHVTLEYDPQSYANWKLLSVQRAQYLAADPLLKELAQAFDCVVQGFMQRAQSDPKFAEYTVAVMGVSAVMTFSLSSVDPMKYKDPALAQLWLLDRSAARVNWLTCPIELEAIVNFDNPEWFANVSLEQRAELEAWCAQPGSLLALDCAGAYIYGLLQDAYVRAQELMPEEALA